MSFNDTHALPHGEVFLSFHSPILEDEAKFSLTLASLLASFFSLLLFAAWPKGTRGRNGLKLPNGPRGLPILGSFPFLTHYPERTLNRWAQKFGNLYSLRLGNQLFVIVSDPDIAKDLMVTNGSVFSGRKEMFIKSQTVFAGRGITATPYNDRWRKHRRIAYTWLNDKAVESYTDVLDREATVMVKAMLEESVGGSLPICPQKHAGRCSLNNMATITFGMRTDCNHHPLVAEALRLSREFMNCTGPVSNLVDFLPFLQKLPTLMSIRGKTLHNDLVKTYGGMITSISSRLAAGLPVPDCLAKTMLQYQLSEGLDDIDMAILASAFMIGGVETTASIMQWFAALIPAYPAIQARAQEELDRVVGRNRLPGIEDEKNLPYVRAIIKEVERTRNPFWLGTPHTATRDFVCKGEYLIPEGTVVVLNTWTMHHKEERYPEPEVFRPERYLGDKLSSFESANLAEADKRDHWMFGAGRRICPGMQVAEREIFLAISRLLWCFNLRELPDEPIDLNEYDGLSGRSPMPFRVNIDVRHEKVVDVLAKADVVGCR